MVVVFFFLGFVSTHSRLKAAGPEEIDNRGFYDCFNTQPPEGGWSCLV